MLLASPFLHIDCKPPLCLSRALSPPQPEEGECSRTPFFFFWDCLCSSGSHSAFSRSTYFNEIAMSKTFSKGPGMLRRGRTSPCMGSENSGSLLGRVRWHSAFPIPLLGDFLWVTVDLEYWNSAQANSFLPGVINFTIFPGAITFPLCVLFLEMYQFTAKNCTLGN